MERACLIHLLQHKKLIEQCIAKPGFCVAKPQFCVAKPGFCVANCDAIPGKLCPVVCYGICLLCYIFLVWCSCWLYCFISLLLSPCNCRIIDNEGYRWQSSPAVNALWHGCWCCRYGIVCDMRMVTVCLFVCLFVWLFVCLFVCLLVCVCVWGGGGGRICSSTGTSRYGRTPPPECCGMNCVLTRVQVVGSSLPCVAFCRQDVNLLPTTTDDERDHGTLPTWPAWRCTLHSIEWFTVH